jgi:hypothetical protein
MRVAVLHLSDFHFRRNTDELLPRARLLVGALNSLEVNPDGLLVVMSGDIAFSGKDEEYFLAEQFLSEMRTAISNWNAQLKTEFIIVPGNHDCDHSSNSELRELVRQTIGPKLNDLAPDSESIQKLLSVQESFFRFRDKVLGISSDPVSRLSTTQTFEVGSYKIQVHSYNTALLSARNENQGSLYIPISHAVSSIKFDTSTALSISVFHHPYNWLESNNSLAFKSLVESTSDLVLTGHQHVESTFTKRLRTGENTLYFEGAALAEPRQAKSAFSALVFDFASGQYKSAHFRWNAHVYVPDKEAEWKPYERNEKVRHTFTNSQQFSEWLNDLGTGFWHPRVSLRLSDIFVYPNLKVSSLTPKAQRGRVSSDEVLDFLRGREAALILGPSQSGKTSLGKMLYMELQPSTVPIFCNGSDFTNASEEQVLKQCWRAFKQQYHPDLLEEFKQLGRKSRTIIIDDWHKWKLNARGQISTLQTLQRHFGRIILLADEIYQIQELALGKDEKKELLRLEHLSIAPFGHELRGRLIENWHALGRELTYEDEEFHREVDLSEKTLQSVVRRNVIQSFPFVILAVIQAKQQPTGPNTPQFGSYGYIFEMLITSALAKVSKDVTDIDTLYTVLSRVAFGMFDAGVSSLSMPEVQQLLNQYEDLYGVSINAERLLKDLIQHRVMVDTSGNYSFRYNHIYLYFVARYFAEALQANDESARARLYKMTDHLASEDRSSILVIVLYLTKDAGLIEHTIGFANRIYSELQPCDVTKDVAFIDSIFTDEPLELESADIAENRERQRRLQDDFESDAPVADLALPYADDLPEVFKLAFAGKALELLGQIVRNFPGSLRGDLKARIVEAEYLLGLRTLHAVLNIVRNSLRQLREVLLERLQEDESGDSADKDLQEVTDALLALLSRILGFTVIKNISNSVGLEKLGSTYDALVKSLEPSVSVRLIDAAIRLDHYAAFPEKEILQLHRALTEHPFARQLLADLVAHHLMLIPTDYRIRQRVCALLGIQMSSVAALANPDKLVRE